MLNPLFDDEIETSEDLRLKIDKLQCTELRCNAMFENVPKQVDFAQNSLHYN